MNLNWYSIKFLPDNKFVKYVAIWLFILPSISKLYKDLPYSWYALFGASLCFAIANAIYMLRCPNIIKDHISVQGFIGDNKTSLHLKEYKKEIKDTDIQIGEKPECLVNNFWELHQKAKQFNYKSLFACYLFYFFGFIFVFFSMCIQSYIAFSSLYGIVKERFLC